VIVTGSSAGIGQANAIDFAKEGASVVIHGQNADRLKKTEELLKAAGVPADRFLSIIGSTEHQSTLEKIVNETLKKFERIDVLVNNAACGRKPDIKDVYSLDNLDYIFNVNLRAVVALTQLAMPHLEKSQGNVVNVSSIGAQKVFPEGMYYCSMKTALDHWSRNLAALYGPKGVRVNIVSPGPIVTMFRERHGLTGQAKEDHYNNTGTMTALGRSGESPEISKVILFVASAEASYMTGANMVADGGMLVFAPSAPKPAEDK